MSETVIPNYGGHHYPGIIDGKLEATSHCRYGCGAWMSNGASGAPGGVDPHADCPKRPPGTEMALPVPSLLVHTDPIESLNLEPMRNFLAACIARATVLSDATARLMVRDFIEAVRKSERKRPALPRGRRHE